MIIHRDFYLNKLIDCEHDGYVKFITGIRRCGKSFLVNTLFKGHLLANGVREENIIEIALDNDDFEQLRNPRSLSSYIREHIVDKSKDYYLLLDEIQMCESVPVAIDGSSSELTFYDVLNGLLKIRNLDIYMLQGQIQECYRMRFRRISETEGKS